MDGGTGRMGPEATAQGWAEAFGAALAGGREAAIAARFRPDAHWRDILGFGWDLRTTSGAGDIAARLV
ncbi:MAG TPA: hypothetical protein VE684_16605, partial [Crenalkalicoccus sp.]|nr:hypothetical protein [Crenalkalicoccus sp.]